MLLSELFWGHEILTRGQQSLQHDPEPRTWQESGTRGHSVLRVWRTRARSRPWQTKPPMSLEGPGFCNQPEPLKTPQALPQPRGRLPDARAVCPGPSHDPAMWPEQRSPWDTGSAPLQLRPLAGTCHQPQLGFRFCKMRITKSISEDRLQS